MIREKLISEVIDNFKNVIKGVDIEEKKAKEIFSEQQLDLVEDVWRFYDDFKDATYEQIDDWNDQLEEMACMY